MRKFSISIYSIFLIYSSVLYANNWNKNNEDKYPDLLILSDEKPNIITIPIHFSAGMGNWSHLNNNQILGNRLMQDGKIGIRIKRLYLDYSFNILSGSINKELDVFLPPDFLVKASSFGVRYSNFSLGYRLLKKEKNEIVVTAGLGRMIFTPYYRDVATDTFY
jgi:hypothetical protein